MFTPEQHLKDTIEFLSQFTPLNGETEASILKLMGEGKIWERYGERSWQIVRRRKPDLKVDMVRLMRLQKKGWLFQTA